MNQQLSRIFLALSLLGAWGFAPWLSAAESDAQQAAPAPTMEQDVEKPAAVTQDSEPVAVAESAEPAAPTQGTEPAVPTQGTEPALPTQDEEPATPTESAEQNAGSTEAAATDESAPEKQPEPITGAFGIILGERFDPGMVAKVISQQEKAYTGREKAKYKGTRYEVEPKAASKGFEKYFVQTTDQGVIYAIQGEYLKAGKGKACKEVTKRLAAELEEQYGKPRGKGLHGEWYSFRDMSVKDYRGVRLYANRCGSGRYTISYSDDKAKKTVLPPEPETQTTQAQSQARDTQAEPEVQAKQAEPKAQAAQEKGM